MTRPAALALALSAFGPAGRAQAHEPAHGLGLLFEDGQAVDPAVVVSNRGVVFVDGAGVSDTQLRCAETWGVSTALRPSVLRSPTGLLVGFYNGVQRSSDRMCTHAFAEGLPDTGLRNLVRAGGAVLVAGQADGLPAIYASQDDGVTFAVRAGLQTEGFLETMFVAPSDASRVYVSGFEQGQAATQRVCVVSADAGATWTSHPVDAGLKLLGVDPADPDVVFAYVPIDEYAVSFRVLRSDDGCVTFTSVLENVPEPTSFSGPIDSSVRYLGLRAVGGKGGLYRSTAPAAPFERVLADQVQTVSCLEQRGDRLWVCANVLPNVEGIWFSDDGAETLESFLTMAEVARPVACETAEARAECAGPWYDFYSELHPVQSAPDAGVTDAGADAAPADAAVEPGDAAPEPKPTKSGGCQTLAAGQGTAPWGLASLCGVLVWLRRRTGRRA